MRNASFYPEASKKKARNLAEIFSFLFLLTERFSLGKVNCFNVFNDWQGLEKMKTDPSQRTKVGGQEIGTSYSKEDSS